MPNAKEEYKALKMQLFVLQIMAVYNSVTELRQKAEESPYWATDLIPLLECSGSLGHQSTPFN